MGAVASKNNNASGGGNGGGNGRGKRERAATVTRVQQKKPQGSSGAEHTNVIFYISREAVERFMLKHLLCSVAEAVEGLDTALTLHVECFAKDLVLPMQSPILFRKPRIRRRIRAALADAANDVSGEFERTTRTWFLHGKPWVSAKTVIELANTDFVETTLGGVVVRYLLHGERGDTYHQAHETIPQVLLATGCNNNEQDRPVTHENTELPPTMPTLPDFDTSEHAIVAGSPDSTPPSPSGQTDREAIASSPPSSSDQVEKAAIAEEVAADALGRIDHDCSSAFKPPPLSLSDEEKVSSLPTPPLSPPPATVSMDDSQFSSPVEPTPLALLPPAIAAAEIVVDGSMDSGNDDDDDSCGDDSSTLYKTPPLSSSSEQGSPASPTPPPSSLSASSMDEPSPSIETPSLTLSLPLVPPPPSSPETFGANPLGQMFSPPLDQPGVISVITDILCSPRVMNDRNKAVRVLMELESGCVCGENMEWVVRRLNTVRATRELKQRHGGRVFVGPRYGAPLYKTSNGVRRLLRGISSKHGAGTKFVVCVSSSSGNAANDMKMITGIISPAPASGAPAPPAAPAPAPASGTAGVEPVVDGDVPELGDWSNIRGNLDDGCRLWAWVY